MYPDQCSAAKDGIRLHVALRAQCRLTPPGEWPTLNSKCARNIADTRSANEETAMGARGPRLIPVDFGG